MRDGYFSLKINEIFCPDFFYVYLLLSMMRSDVEQPV